MTITLNSDYDVTLSTALLGYVGETNARPVTVEGMEIDGADRYVLSIDYGDGTVYEVDITGGQWTPTADILRSAQTVSCQICAKKLSGDEHILVKKSRIFRLRIGAAIGDTAIPSPDVAMDALDRIDAIGRQAHADMQTAQSAAETATTAAENAKKSATAAGLSADAAEQAASRAETAKTAAETSATQAETAKQGAETARAEAVKSQNDAKVSAAQASTAAQQTEADKTITAGYAKTAKTCADSTAADRQAVQTLAEQVTADKAIVADHAAKVAEDKTAAETAAQTAQAVADSLPDDYVTAVGKIAENAAEIANVKLTDKELQRRVNALYDMGTGITHRFETDSSSAYQKTVPTGGKLMSVKNIGGRSIVFNQLAIRTAAKTDHYGITVTVNDDGTINLHGTVSAVPSYNQLVLTQQFSIALNGHKYLYRFSKNTTTTNQYGVCGFGTKGISSFIFSDNSGVVFAAMPYIHVVEGDVIDIDNLGICVFDLTAMFGKGNEPTTAEEFEKIFPADYYPYNAGEIVSAGTEEVAVGDTTHQIPEAIRNLPGYGWSAGTARNYVDYENKRYVQCVQSVDLGTLEWLLDGNNWWYNTKIPKGLSDSNAICNKRTYVLKRDTGNETQWCHSGGGYFEVYVTDVTTSADVSKKLSGVILYYELATPIVTDISSLIPDDFLRNMEVEAGGSVTFKNGNGDSYRIPVPNEEEYIVKLSEVGGTT